ncbi:polysaccharide deacetylase family protein [Roseateles albus]|nr:polysaccharide deacetylase family protein [Roseateles albus]
MWKMKTAQALFLATALLNLTASARGAQGQPFQWPKGERAAVSLAYDDALNSQLDNAIPALNRADLRGSFYLTLSSDVVSRRMNEWRAAAAAGHELGNHTLFHQCSRAGSERAWVSEDNDLDKISASQLAAQIRVGNTLLRAIDGKTERSFTAPCTEHLAGGQNYLTLIKGDFVAIKAKVGGVVPDMAQLDPYAVSVFVPLDASGAQLIALVDQAAQAGTMINITFHGIGGDHLSVSTQAHAELLNYLAARRDVFWIDTFVNIMKYVKGMQGVKETGSR